MPYFGKELSLAAAFECRVHSVKALSRETYRSSAEITGS